MWKKVITAISLMLISTLYLMACGAEGIETGEEVLVETDENNTDTGAEVSEESELEELTGELVIMSWLPFNNWEQVIEDFTAEHPGVTVTLDMPKQEELLTAEFMERYTTRIMTGEGFDLVESDFVNMEKCAEQDVFVDLYELIHADNDFHREDYFSCIFEAVEIDGKLPAFVYNVMPAYIHLNKKLLERAGLEYTKDTISFKELYELYEKVREVAGERIFLEDSMYGYEGMSNYEDGYFVRNNLMDSDEYEEYLKMRHELYFTAENRSPWLDGSMKIEFDVLCCASDLRLPRNSALDMDINDFFMGTEDMTGAIVYESMHGERYPESIAGVSISNYSQNKELAWEFIKFAFSDSDISRSTVSMISPNKRRAENVCEELSPENREKLFRDIEAINTFKFVDLNLDYNLQSVYEDYFVNNTITSEECCKELASRVYLYLNE